MSTGANGTAEHDIIANGGIVDAGDEGSSSLSEPEESIEDRDEAELREPPSPAAEENDSEAETERIESTPRRPARTVTDATNGSEGLAGRSPSKLAKVVTAEQENLSQSPALPTRQRRAESEADELSEEDEEALADDKPDPEADAEDSATVEGSDRKRKRSSSALSSIADDLDNDQPVRKRPSPGRPYELNGDPMEVDGEMDDPTAEEEYGHPVEPTEGPLADEEENEEAAHEAASGAAIGSKKAKGKKGQRKGKKGKVNENDEHAATPLAEAEEEEAHEGELEGEDTAVIEEERGRKHNALEELNKIEKQFLTFQKKRLEEQLERLSVELEQLKQPNSTHHEYLLMLQAVDKRRDEKIRQEDVRLGLKRDILRKQFVAMRNSIHGQYMHDVAELRMSTLTECNKRITQLQRERRYWGTNEQDYTVKFTQKRSQQVQQQTAYNLEVSILSGIAKHVGFPAAPDLAAARNPEMDQDLAAMGIQNRPTQPPARPAIPADPSRADRAAAEEQFFEQNAWANPQHPAHNHAHYQVAGPQQRVVSNPFATPAAQRERIDLQAPNGSASTIDMQSNPPSGTAAHQRDAYESPIMQMKQAVNRNQENHHAPVDTPIRPGSHHSARETSQHDSHRAARDLYEGSALMSQLGMTGATQSAAVEGPASTSAIKDEDAGEQLHRAALSQRTGVVGGGLFR
ncbi:hypothetical protein B0J12DRAFT_695971 [Macrophomina phaseolina]|uniref:Sds3-like protein n=1 Tax=Macrophomina phaseolina TaxID=35725 RepID=A0ABQ8GLT1_9PEZI|nr:hypothetical protein B0J12DRAFT_695971 [Macrophomina phaseolina]